MKSKIMTVLVVLLSCLLLFAGCEKSNETSSGQEEKKFASLSDFSGTTLGFLNGTPLELSVRETIPDFETRWVTNYIVGLEDVKFGKADAYVTDLPIATRVTNMNPELAVFPQLATVDNYAYCFNKGSKYVDGFNKALAQLKESGKLAEIDEYWIASGAEDKQLEPQKSSGANGTIKIGGSAGFKPMVYTNGNGKIIGRDIAVCNAICDILDLKAEYYDVSYSALGESLSAGKIDVFCGTVYVTEERKQVMDFCDTTYSGGAALIVRKDRIADEAYANFGALDEKLAGKKIGIMTGSAAVMSVENEYPDAEVVEINAISDAVEMLKSGKLDYVLSSRSTCLNFAKYNKELCVIDKEVISGDKTAAYIAVNKENKELLNDINTILDRYLDDGTIAAIEENWLGENAAYDMSGIPENADAPVLKVGMDVSDEPMDFVLNGENAGYDCELIERIAYDMGMKVEYVNMSFPSLIPALQSGKVDVVISDITATDERREMVDFTDPYYANPQVLLARKADVGAAAVTDNVQYIPDDLDTACYGLMQGGVAIGHIEENYPNAKIMEFDAIGDAVEALKANKVDYVMTAYSNAKNFERYNKELYTFDGIKFDEDTSMAVRKGNTELKDKINEILDGYSKDGTLDGIIENWLSDNAPYDISGFPENTEDAVLNVGISANREPMCFIMDGKYCGVDCELIERIAHDMGMRVEYQDMKFAALIPALDSGKVDVIISNIAKTEERAQVVDFTDPYYNNPQVLIMRRDEMTSAAVSDNGGVSESFIDKIKASFTRTFITESRWKLVLNGLGVTILISLCSFVIGSLWGGVICAGLRSSQKIANVPAKVYVRLLQGTPIVVLLMILYYIIFKSFDISAIIVAIIGFALNLGAYTSEIFRTAIDSVDKGQIEAASAIGFSKFKVSTKIIFPQAARNALPVYKGEFISLVKSTSIVGYIAIQDLTKASDIIRSRTYEAFFPLIATAIIYFVVTYIFIVLLNMLEKKIDPKRRKRTLKGVVLK